MTNSFHQFVLTEKTSQMLAVQMPWGLIQPNFLPEGVSPASGYLQATMMKITEKMSSWLIVIFDNILLLANDPGDAVAKTKILQETFEYHNVILK